MFLFFQTILPLKKNCQSFRRSAVVLKTHSFSCQAKNELCPRVVLRQNAMSTRLPGKMGRPLKQFSDAVNDASLLGFSGTMTPWPGEFLFREKNNRRREDARSPAITRPAQKFLNKRTFLEREEANWGLRRFLLGIGTETVGRGRNFFEGGKWNNQNFWKKGPSSLKRPNWKKLISGRFNKLINSTVHSIQSSNLIKFQCDHITPRSLRKNLILHNSLWWKLRTASWLQWEKQSYWDDRKTLKLLSKNSICLFPIVAVARQFPFMQGGCPKTSTLRWDFQS